MFSDYLAPDCAISQRQQVVNCLNAMLASIDVCFTEGDSGISFGQTCAHYDRNIAEMEGLSRILWGLFPLLASGEDCPFWPKYLNAIRHGTDASHAGYWGETGPYDQRLVEMAVYGLGLALMKNRLTDQFTETEKLNLHHWLNQISTAEMPDSNWNYFAILVQVGFKQAGLPYDPEIINMRFNKMEAYYLGNGWYSDGLGRPKDYYISMAFHYYGLIYATLMAQEDPQRSLELRNRAKRFAEDFIYMFSSEGPAIPFGRSLTYRFAESAFWSAAAFAGLDILSPGEMKGIVLRHLRWWLKQPIFDRDGILTIGYAYPNLIMAEDYNSPGSPYWAFKLFLILALPDTHPFWQAEEAALPSLLPRRKVAEANQILCHEQGTVHAYMLTSGQIELNNYVNTEAKYTKFAYSSHLGFTLERGRFGLKHAACDSMLLLSEGDDYYRGRRECTDVITEEDAIFSRWAPWTDVNIATWLVPWDGWHIRVHRIKTDRTLDTVEGGFAVMHGPQTIEKTQQRRCRLEANNGTSVIVDLSTETIRNADKIITPPNSNIMFAECATIPVLTRRLETGTHWLCCAVTALIPPSNQEAPLPEFIISGDSVRLIQQHREITLLIR
ncbi:DUF2264 domain-containing protein [Acerihabitans sp. TG2]|uniref:DUF2264 domain-containing protein n=1 Tax=Acerihabitans sp. TG2 TaxID=3096008 RepID=UPI002B23B282|nr:DUF2264 domain-containing protein [Acerihabitans sp. TG2]MEA9392066.1 DUF2264 domain-containing protein [Acerihabitans sp. TG2]